MSQSHPLPPFFRPVPDTWPILPPTLSIPINPRPSPYHDIPLHNADRHSPRTTTITRTFPFFFCDIGSESIHSLHQIDHWTNPGGKFSMFSMNDGLYCVHALLYIPIVASLMAKISIRPSSSTACRRRSDCSRYRRYRRCRHRG